MTMRVVISFENSLIELLFSSTQMTLKNLLMLDLSCVMYIGRVLLVHLLMRQETKKKVDCRLKEHRAKKIAKNLFCLTQKAQISWHNYLLLKIIRKSFRV